MYMNELPDDQAEVMMTPLMMDESTFEIPTFSKPITKPEDPAPAFPSVSPSSLWGQTMPRARTQPM